MTEPTLLAIDQGTTSSRAILFNTQGEIVAKQQKSLTLSYPESGWVEANPMDLWADTLWTCQRVIKDAVAEAANIIGIGITNQRETTIVWNRKTGHPVYNAIVWQDRRTAEYCEELRQAGHEDMIADKTGLLIDPYFSASKIAWILERVDGAREAAERGDLAFGTVDSYLLWNLTGRQLHATDATNAARTMLFNIQEQRWDEELLALFNIPANMLPQVMDNVDDYGETQLLGRPIPICGMAGDQHAALIGQACLEHGMVKSTYGTGCFTLMNIGDQFKKSEHRLLTTQAYRIGGKSTYAVEGSIFIAGAAVQWLRDGMGWIKDAAGSEGYAISVENTGGVYFVPSFTGLGAPHWRPDARGMIMGLNRDSGAPHIIRAALEAQAYQTLDLMGAFEADTGNQPAVIRADGGLMSNSFVCQFLADMLNKPVEIPKVTESTAWGAACLVGLKTGVFNDLGDIANTWSASKRFEPEMEDDMREELYSGWKQAVGMLL